jgi:hypothetical protein
MMKQEFDSYPNSTTKISRVMTIMSPASPEFKMLQEGLAFDAKQWAGSIHFKGRF